jgi:hypothetical protein
MSVGLVVIDSATGLPFVQDGYELIHMRIQTLMSWLSSTYGSLVTLNLVNDGTPLVDLMKEPPSKDLQDLMDEHQECTELWIEVVVVRLSEKEVAAGKRARRIAALKEDVDAAHSALESAIAALVRAEVEAEVEAEE